MVKLENETFNLQLVALNQVGITIWSRGRSEEAGALM